MHGRRNGAWPNDVPYGTPRAASPFEDDDYIRFLKSLGGDEALPEEDDDDPDFDDDLRKFLEDLSDDERHAFPFFQDDPAQQMMYHPWDYPPQHPFESHPLPPLLPADQMPDPHMQQAPVLDGADAWSTNGMNDLDQLSPAWCTRSRYPLNTTDIDDLAERLGPVVDYTTYDEIPECRPMELPTEIDLRFDNGFERPLTRRQRRLIHERATRETTQPLRRKSGPYIKRTRYEKPSPSFTDIFPTELFCAGGRQADQRPVADEMQVNTLKGIVRMQTDAWTPQMILCLNRIIAAHTQLLAQTFTLCMGYPHLREVVEEMHVQLHSMYQLLQAQAHFDFGFDTMLKTDMPHLETKTSSPCKAKRSLRRPVQQQSKKRRRRKTSVEAVIDLTEDSTEDQPPEKPIFGSCLDVPVLQVLPHLWQALMVISFSKKGVFFDADSQLVDPCTRRMGYLPSLEYPRDIQRVMQLLDGLMSCGHSSATGKTEIPTRGSKWVGSELALLNYAVMLHKENYLTIRKYYFPHRDVRTLDRRLQSMPLDFDKHWKHIESLLLGTDKVRNGATGCADQILRVQGQLLLFCDGFKTAQKGTGAVPVDRVNLGPPQKQSAVLLKLMQEVVRKSTSQLVTQVFGNEPSMGLPAGGTNTTVMQNLMCLLLGQIGGHLAGSFDTLFTMMSVIAGMQLIHGADQSSPPTQQFEIVEISQPECDPTAQLATSFETREPSSK